MTPPKRKTSKSRNWSKLTPVVTIVGILLILFACLFRFGILNRPGQIKLDVASTLTEAIDIAKLSTAEYRYRGIADVYSDPSKENPTCRVCYNAVVKAGIDMRAVTFAVDDEAKLVTATLPELELTVTLDHESTPMLLPSNADVEMDVILKASRADAEAEARSSEALFDTARENLKRTIEGLTLPILESAGYRLVWSNAPIDA